MVDLVTLKQICNTHNNKKFEKSEGRRMSQNLFLVKPYTSILPLLNKSSRICNPTKNMTVIQRTKYPWFYKKNIMAL